MAEDVDVNETMLMFEVVEVAVTRGMVVKVTIELIEVSLTGYKSTNGGSISVDRRASAIALKMLNYH